MSLKQKAKETLQILQDGGFRNKAGDRVDISAGIRFAVENTVLYTPEQFASLTRDNASNSGEPVFDVTTETTQIAASRLVREGCEDLVLLNFASARNPGGGFINGAKAQEEDLTRCSALYDCLMSQPEYYNVNREQKSMLYTDHVIYSPGVPWFRTRSRDDPDEVFLASVITAPAPNANQARRRGVHDSSIEAALHRRCGQVLGVARENGHRNILLGAWGCGVFGNNPSTVAKAFKDWLLRKAFKTAFDRVVFAVYSNSKEKATYSAFKAQYCPK